MQLVAGGTSAPCIATNRSVGNAITPASTMQTHITDPAVHIAGIIQRWITGKNWPNWITKFEQRLKSNNFTIIEAG